MFCYLQNFNNQTGIVEVEAFGTCLQYSKAFITIQKATLNLLKFYIPEVTSVQSDGNQNVSLRRNSQVGVYKQQP